MRRARDVGFALVALCSLGLTVPALASNFQVGDVFAAIGNGQVDVFTPTGTLVQTLNDGTGSTFTAGMAFDNLGNLYVTNFSIGTVSEFDKTGALVNANFITGQVNNESIATEVGKFPILVGDAGQNKINQYNSSGVLVNSFTVATQNRGTDWVDLQPDNKTVLYTSEGSSVLSFNISTNTQNANFANGLPGVAAYALREIQTGPFAGDVLVADSSNALLLNSAGGIIMTYNLPGNSGVDFALNLDPSGTDFWTADLGSGEVWELNIASGNILEQWNTGFPGTTGGLAVFGEAGQGTGTPEPATLFLLGSGLLGLGLASKLGKRKRAA